MADYDVLHELQGHLDEATDQAAWNEREISNLETRLLNAREAQEFALARVEALSSTILKLSKESNG